MANKAKVLSLRDRIREIEDIESELVEIPEWKCAIDMRTPTSAEASALEEWAADHAGNADDENPDPRRFRGLKEQYIMCCAYDPETGKQLFSEADLEWLRDKNAKVIERLWKKAQRLVGLTEDEAEALGKGSGRVGTKSSGTT